MWFYSEPHGKLHAKLCLKMFAMPVVLDFLPLADRTSYSCSVQGPSIGKEYWTHNSVILFGGNLGCEPLHFPRIGHLYFSLAFLDLCSFGRAPEGPSFFTTVRACRCDIPTVLGNTCVQTPLREAAAPWPLGRENFVGLGFKCTCT